MPEQPSTLAARIRAKYPGVYDDIADGELEQRVAAKFPGAYDDIPRTEATLTRERRAPGAPSAMEAGHHPETGGREMFGKRIPSLDELRKSDATPSDAAFLRRAPEVGGTAGMMVSGPLGAGAGAAAGSLVKGQFERGAHMPTSGEAGDAALEGSKALVLGGAPRALAAGARAIGPAVARHAPAISRGINDVAGIATGAMTGNALTGLGASAAAKALTNPSAIQTAGNVAARIGTVPSHAVNKTGFGLLTADAVRQALLEALGSAEQP